MGHYVCLSAAARLLGIGTGRATKVRRALREGLDAPVLDGRIAAAKKFAQRAVSVKRELIHNFLHSLYVKCTESLPEGTSCSALVPSSRQRFNTARGKRPRILKKREAKKDPDTECEVRYLPPGNYVDYLRLLQSENPAARVSLRLFMRAARWFIIIKGFCQKLVGQFESVWELIGELRGLGREFCAAPENPQEQPAQNLQRVHQAPVHHPPLWRQPRSKCSASCHVEASP